MFLIETVMSVVKNKRNKSSIEFESLYFKLADNIDNLVEHKFYASKELIEMQVSI